MSLLPAGPYTLTIASGQTDSAALSTLFTAGQLKTILGSASRLAITPPAAVTNTISIEVVAVEGGSDWTTLQTNGTDVSVTADKTNFIPFGGIRDLRIHSSGAEGADRDFILNFQLSVD